MSKRSRTFRRTRSAALFLNAGLAATACSSDLIEPNFEPAFQVQSVGETDLRFVMTQNVVPPEAMEAFFDGLVISDGTGCIRLEDGEGPTVVWPRGYTGEVANGRLSILDANGTEVGEIGGSFSFGGGVISELLATLGFTEADRELAEGLCPGSYWIFTP